jgi:hypothetical protein
MAVAACEVDACGVQAIGRCQSCGLAFCATHQGVAGTGHPRFAYRTKFRDQCASCTTAVERSAREERARYEAEDAIFEKPETLVSIASQMAEAECPGLEAREARWHESEKRLFGSRRVERSFVGEPAWRLGRYQHEFSWADTTLTDYIEVGVTRGGVVVGMPTEEEQSEGDQSARPSWAYEGLRERLTSTPASLARRLLAVAEEHGVEVELPG